MNGDDVQVAKLAIAMNAMKKSLRGRPRKRASTPTRQSPRSSRSRDSSGDTQGGGGGPEFLQSGHNNSPNQPRFSDSNDTPRGIPGILRRTGGNIAQSQSRSGEEEGGSRPAILGQLRAAVPVKKRSAARVQPETPETLSSAAVNDDPPMNLSSRQSPSPGSSIGGSARRVSFADAVKTISPPRDHPEDMDVDNELDREDLDFLNVNAWPTFEQEDLGEETAAGESGDLLQWAPDYNSSYENWRLQFSTMAERYQHMWDNSAFSKYQVSIEVGRGTDKWGFPVHTLILATQCDFFKKRLSQHVNTPIHLPDFDPMAFGRLLQYVYDPDRIELLKLSVDELFDLFHTAKECGFQELQSKCEAQIKKIGSGSSSNIVVLFQLAHAAHSIAIQEWTLLEIAKNPKAAFASDGLLKLTEDAFCSLLENDNWFLDEIEVFKGVIRWAEEKAFGNAAKYEQSSTRVALLRQALGKVLYAVRFPLMKKEDFFAQVDDKYTGLLSSDEQVECLRYFCRPSKTEDLQYFVFRPRSNGLLSTSCSSSTNLQSDAEPQSLFSVDNISVADHIFEDSMECSSTVNLDLNDENQDGNNLDGAPPPKKQRRRQSADTGQEKTLNQVKQNLYNQSDTQLEDITEIEKTVSIVKCALTKRVHLPNLTSFKLNLTKDFSIGCHFKRYVKKSVELKNLLFFDKRPSQSQSFYESLLQERVNIFVTISGATILVVNHDEGTLVMNLIKDAQEIINHSGSLPLKRLAISECDKLDSLQPIRRDFLEVLVIRKQRELTNHMDFIKSCKNLKVIACNDFVGNNLNITDVFSTNPYLEKLSLSKCNISMTEGCANIGGDFLRELYLDNVSFVSPNLINSFHTLFPYVKHVVLYFINCETDLLYSVLQMPSVEWIFVWQFEHNYSRKSNGRQLRNVPNKSERIRNLLEGIFDKSANHITFVLEKISANPAQAGSSSSVQTQDPFDKNTWKGSKFSGRKRYDEINRLDYENFSYDQFYETFRNFRWSETNNANEVARLVSAATDPVIMKAVQRSKRML